ncbi:MAG: hypothetical protein KQH79_17485 [Bacteroidetes bacterium]|nr:hypothetical protein [Bacteroidota bacterium]
MIIGIIIWIVLCIILANAGSKRKIGAAGAFFISFLLSPLIGFIVVMVSDPLPPKQPVQPINKKAQELKDQATSSYKAKDYQVALENMKEAIKIDPGHSYDHFNIACIYSKLENKEHSFKHLQRAVELGYNKFENINSSPGLDFLRKQPEFEDFALNGYKK